MGQVQAHDAVMWLQQCSVHLRVANACTLGWLFSQSYLPNMHRMCWTAAHGAAFHPV